MDSEVVVDRGLVTSRRPDDIPAFNEKMIALFSGVDAGWSKSADGNGKQARPNGVA